jgi:tetratricopeptide (TPR) repeat protein
LVGLKVVTGHFEGKAEKLEATATAAYQKGDFEKSIEAWHEARQTYASIYHSQGQTDALLGISECYLKQGRFQDAIGSLNQALRLEDSPAIENQIGKCHRLQALACLKASDEQAGIGQFDNALQQAQLALKELQEGQGSNSQMAGAYRTLSLRYAQLGQFDVADQNLALALKQEGESKQNLALDEQLGKMQESYERRRLAQSRNERYIPDGELDLSSLQPVVESPQRYKPRRRATRPVYRPVTRVPSYYRSSRPQVKQTQLGVQPDYPQRETSRSKYQRNNKNRYYPSYYSSPDRRPSPRIVYPRNYRPSVSLGFRPKGALEKPSAYPKAPNYPRPYSSSGPLRNARVRY